MAESGRVTSERVSSELRPDVTRLFCAVTDVVRVVTPAAGLDDRTMQRLHGPVDAAAKLPVDGTAGEVVDAARTILEAGPPAPPDALSVGPVLAELRDALGAYERVQRPRSVLSESLQAARPRPGELAEALRAARGE
jgi:hypothetical protein